MNNKTNYCEGNPDYVPYEWYIELKKQLAEKEGIIKEIDLHNHNLREELKELKEKTK